METFAERFGITCAEMEPMLERSDSIQLVEQWQWGIIRMRIQRVAFAITWVAAIGAAALMALKKATESSTKWNLARQMKISRKTVTNATKLMQRVVIKWAIAACVVVSMCAAFVHQYV